MRIIVLSEKLAQKYSYEITQKAIIISITCPPEDNVLFADNNNILDIFNMKFNDLDSDVDENYKAPIQSDFNGLKNFIDKYKDKIEEIVVHCGAGASRSPACALAICDYLKEKITYKNMEYSEMNYNKKVYSLALNEFGIGKDESYYQDIFK